MNFNRFSIHLMIRSSLLFLTLLLLVKLITFNGYFATTAFVLILSVIQAVSLYRYINKTNIELARFLDAAKYDDFGQRFDFQHLGAGFSQLGNTFTNILNKSKTERNKHQSEIQHVNAIVEHVPVPLISYHSAGTIKLWNHSARRLFGHHNISNINDLSVFGHEFRDYFNDIKLSERRLLKFDNDGLEQVLSLSASQVIIAGESEYLISLQDIQNELDIAQLQAWQDLVRVLTHEIMNSITPVASLAKTAADLVDDAKAKITHLPDVVEELDDVGDAVNTVARRSDSLVKFVSSYRQLTRLPAPKKTLVKVNQLFDDVKALTENEWHSKNIRLSCEIIPKELEVSVDEDMFNQVLINIIRNAAQALISSSNYCEVTGEISLSARLNRQGKVVIDIKDNGPGITDEIAEKIFVPLFTTKRDGSGVGLALTRQIIIAHNGYIKFKNREQGGAHFSLII